MLWSDSADLQYRYVKSASETLVAEDNYVDVEDVAARKSLPGRLCVFRTPGMHDAVQFSKDTHQRQTVGERRAVSGSVDGVGT